MKRTWVDSSAILSVGYDPDSKTLEIEFKHGGIYQYLAVPKTVFIGLMKAPSKGAYYDEKVKKPGYDFRQVG
ncbi:MAG: hypothetical protein JWO03_3516 [Bacteroidetes bacterium]|nr:hypothetical protein [Bacteroidota bacterium]